MNTQIKQQESRMTLQNLPGKVLYQETCGQAEIFISQYGDSWIVGGNIDGNYRERMFNPSPYPDKQPYDLAIKCYDATLENASRIYGIERQLPDKPNFEFIVNKI